MNTRFLILFILLSISLYSQDGTESPLATIIPPSPSAYDLGKYGQIPVGMATGTAQVDIPLYTYKTANLSVPLSLNYASNGLKVDQVEGHTGLGWSLNTGGVITRIVRGLPDEQRRGVINDDHCFSEQFITYIHKNHKNNDTQPDLYMYNFMGHTGQFVFDNNGNPVLVPHNALKVQKIEGGFTGGYFIITTEDGVKYEFNSTESTTIESVEAPRSVVTAWNLTKITHPKGDEIYFSYESDSYIYSVNEQSIIKVLIDYPGQLCPGKQTPVAPEIFRPPSEKTILNISAGIIKNIHSNNPESGTVVFDHIAHPDSQLNYHKMVKGLNVFDKSNTPIESATFDYLFTSSKRVFLEKVIFRDPEKTYLLEYNQPTSFPRRLYSSQDLWGYHKSTEGGEFPDPMIHKDLYGLQELSKKIRNEISGADKNTDEGVKIGMLKKITYPTKGYNLFEYEPNTIWGKVTTPIIVRHQGLYLDNENDFFQKTDSHVFTNTHDYETKLDANFTFRGLETEHGNFPTGQYEVTAILEALTPVEDKYTKYLKLDAVEHNKKQERNVRLAPNTQYKITAIFSFASKRASAKVNISHANGGGITTEQNVPYNGARIKKTTAHDISNQITDYKRYYYGSGPEDKSSGNKGIRQNLVEYTKIRTRCPGQISMLDYVENTFMTIYSSSIYPLYNVLGNGNITYGQVTVSQGGENFEQGGEENYFFTSTEAPPNTCINSNFNFSPWTNYQWNNGLIQKKKVLNSDKKVIQETEYTYQNDTRKRQSVPGLHLKIKYNRFFSSNDMTDPRNIEHINIARYVTNSYWFYLASEKNTVFNSNGKAMTSTTNYHYENPVHAQKTKIENIDAQGNISTTQIYYPDDVYTPSSLPVPYLTTAEFSIINRLKKDRSHQIATPIQTDLFKNGQSINSQRVTYNFFNNLILPEKIATKKGASTTFEENLVYKKYDSRGNPLEAEVAGGLTVVFLWGHNQSLPIAKIENTTVALVLSKLGITEQQLSSLNENSMVAINNLRNLLPEANVYTYTYQPLIGISTQTDPMGQKTSYEYDPYFRLKNILDPKQNILINYEYNYLK